MGQVPCVHLNQLHDVLKPLERMDDDSAVCPWTNMVKVENVAALLGSKSLRRNRVSEIGRHSVALV